MNILPGEAAYWAQPPLQAFSSQRKMGATESREDDRLCGSCSDETGFFAETACVKRNHPQERDKRETVMTPTERSRTDTVEHPSPRRHYVAQPTQDSWRFNASADEAVGVGAYFGRLEGQNDSVARVKSLVSMTFSCSLQVVHA